MKLFAVRQLSYVIIVGLLQAGIAYSPLALAQQKPANPLRQTPAPETHAPLPAEESLPFAELQRFARVYAAIKNSYVEPVDDQKLIESAIKGMVQDLDPHSAYLDALEYEEMRVSTDGEFGGLGIEIGPEKGFVKIISPIEDTPAAKAGIQPGDIITGINGESMEGKPLNDVVKNLRGDVGTPIKLSVSRPSTGKQLDFDLVRAVIKVQSVRSKMLPDSIAYVRISQFQERTGPDLATHLKQLDAKGKPKGLVLDLRNDPGGLLTGAIGVSAAFLKPGINVVSTKSRGDQDSHVFKADPQDYVHNASDYLKELPSWTRTVPMVVLINVGSASAAEIVAGALQDHKRATVMGNRSFGKGSVQVVMPLDDNTALKLTTARYFTPSGRSIQATGIVPDIVVTDTEKGDLFSFPREADLAEHLSNDQAGEGGEVKGTTSIKADETAEEREVFEFGSTGDFQLAQAVNKLLDRPVKGGAPVAEKSLTEKERKAEEKSVDATSGAKPAAGQGDKQQAPEPADADQRDRAAPSAPQPADSKAPANTVKPAAPAQPAGK
ncbi:S41 family peptidase [Advenella mimigardefordensis]|uniref:Carboxy-terminal-processing protease n=1 Tax=Advenella mimigardefordensis (strain DSM 17166 / LMG 22922 / DPN7) TaxID=1247726 RepID=W0PBH8_ADVMD|nr:S41 family peptidase [Advenella mimigardefordensis]AHG62842.1 carboxy-terminal-processing protease [Advenella mimigardefordensis DPN7]